MEAKERRKILLVDDEEDIQKVIGRRLDKAGFEVLVASSGAEAITTTEKELPDLVLLDIGLPDMDGIEVCKRIKKHEFISGVPIIFFSARDKVDEKIKGLRQGVHDYITKPIDHRELLARIEAVLKISRHYREISLTDDLTGLYNYNFFEEQFTHYFDLAKRYQRVSSLVICDVDNFKQINDNYGHLLGNMVLKEVSDRIKNAVRKVDIVVRYGGDEFAIILPETDYERASEVLERLKNAVSGIELNYKGRAIAIKASLSFGLATYKADIKTKEEFFNIADKNMYADKKAKHLQSGLKKRGGSIDEKGADC